jgi:hypothetical protein
MPGTSAAGNQLTSISTNECNHDHNITGCARCKEQTSCLPRCAVLAMTSRHAHSPGRACRVAAFLSSMQCSLPAGPLKQPLRW